MAKTGAKATKKTAKKAAKIPIVSPIDTGVFGLPVKSWVSSAKVGRASDARGTPTAQFFVLANPRDKKEFRAALRASLLPWQLDHAEKSDADTLSYAGRTGPVFIVRTPGSVDQIQAASHNGKLEKSSQARLRDQAGSLLPLVLNWRSPKLAINFVGSTLEEEQAILLGLELASYNYLENRNNPRRPRKKLPSIILIGAELAAADIRAAGDLGVAMNVARHLTNLPGGDLNPRTYAEMIESMFAGDKNFSVETWEGDRLASENCNLLRAVGAAADEGPRLVHVKYRPAGSEGKRPIALVGKGITFDSGGLDIKPSAGMRWMKKDMGGSAAVVGLGFWAMRSEIPQPLDLYFAIAENAIGGGAFRPGDIVTARNGMTIEIHNTDAEGRLVLADALDVAATQSGSDAPLAIIDLATLTGAIKVALGGEIAGLFSNNDGLAEMIEISGQAAGELAWRMPLHQPYKPLLRSTFSDMSNASEGFAGAITAAIFLQQFVGRTPWAHLDIYGWKDSAGGAWTESGGSGQGVQTLAQLLTSWSEQGIGE